MANKTITMLIIRRILQLKSQGQSNRAISKQLQLNRATINSYVKRFEQYSGNWQELQALNDEDLSYIGKAAIEIKEEDWRYNDFLQRQSQIYEELKTTRATKMILWEEYRQLVPEGYSYTQFCEHLNRYTKTKQSVMHFSHAAGEELQFDFAGDELSYVNIQSGELISCPVLVCVLPYSGYIYIEALRNGKREHLINGLNNCFLYIGGVPKNVKTDNMRQWVNKANRYEPTFNEFANQWALHYGCSLTATRVKKPRDKAHAESSVNTVYNRIYAVIRNKTAHSLDELNAIIREALEQLNHRKMQQNNYSRYERFIQYEKPILNPLPAEIFVPKQTITATVQRNYHLMLGEDKHYYSVPYEYIGQKVEVIYDTSHVEIYNSKHQRIASYRRNYAQYAYTSIAEHMPQNHQYYSKIKGYNPQYFTEEAEKIGINTAKAIKSILKQKIFQEQTYNSCLGIMRLAKQYSTQRLEQACKRALIGPKVTYTIIKNILKNNLDQANDSPDLFSTIQNHENIRGENFYQ
jgi:transposase